VVARVVHLAATLSEKVCTAGEPDPLVAVMLKV
jgi:hypothetical protein